MPLIAAPFGIVMILPGSAGMTDFVISLNQAVSRIPIGNSGYSWQSEWSGPREVDGILVVTHITPHSVCTGVLILQLGLP